MRKISWKRNEKCGTENRGRVDGRETKNVDEQRSKIVDEKHIDEEINDKAGITYLSKCNMDLKNGS